jgi:heat shock protein HslJ
VRTVTVWLLAGALAFVSGCGGDEDDDDGAASPARAPTAEALAGTTFVSTEVDGDEFVEGTTLTLGFPEAGRITAEAGCNSYFGDFRVAAGALVVGQLGGTLIGCPAELQQQDEWVAAFLASEPKITLAGDTLTLTGADATITLVDREVVEPDVPLEGTRWEVESLVTLDAVSSVPVGQAAFLEFADGQVSGNAGCNQLHGAATIGEDTITFGPIATTRRACPDATALEAHVLEVLTGEVAYEIDGDQARLTHASGKGLECRGGG